MPSAAQSFYEKLQFMYTLIPIVRKITLSSITVESVTLKTKCSPHQILFPSQNKQLKYFENVICNICLTQL
jgi:hypothetical protein